MNILMYHTINAITCISKQMQTAIAENSRVVIDQNEYEKRYAELTARYEKARAKYDDIAEQIESKKAKRELFKGFIRTLEKQDGITCEFDAGIWSSLVQEVIVKAKDDMKILEFGDTSKSKIILIHGFQCPWQVWNKYIEYYKNKFHIIVPIMSGHNPEVKDDFISFASDAKEIEEYILSRYGKEIYAVYGMSMGGVLTATLWQNNRLSFDKVIFDGSPLVSYNSFMKVFMKKFYVDITHKSQQRDKKTVEQATKVIISEDNLEFKKHYPNTTVKCFKGKFHCENALFHPEIMIEELDKIFDK